MADCLQCGTPFAPICKPQKFCSPACTTKWHNSRRPGRGGGRYVRKKPASVATCPVCSSAFTTANCNHVFCSKACWYAKHAHKYVAPPMPIGGRPQRACLICGKPFQPSWHGGANRVFCGKACNLESDKRRDRLRRGTYFRAKKHRGAKLTPEQRRERNRRYYAANKAKFQKYHRDYYARKKPIKADYSKSYYANNRPAKLEYAKSRYLIRKANGVPRKLKAYAELSEAQRERLRQKARDYYSRNKDRMRQYAKQRYAANPRKGGPVTPARREAIRAGIRSLSDAYVRNVLAYGTDCSANDFPPELVELKRLHLLLKREKQKQTYGDNSQTDETNRNNSGCQKDAVRVP